MNKKIILLSLMVGFLMAGLIMPTGRVLAQTNNDFIQSLRNQIQALLDKVKVLQEQLAATQGQGQGWCYTFNTNLRIGDNGDGVLPLQHALDKEGFPEVSQEWMGSGGAAGFGEITAGAVSGFQEKYRSEILTPNGLKSGTGYVGVSTRKKLNQLYGCGLGQVPPNKLPIRIRVVSPAAGEKLTQGKTYPIKWSGGNGIIGIQILDSKGNFVGWVTNSAESNGEFAWDPASYEEYNPTVKVLLKTGQYKLEIGTLNPSILTFCGSALKYPCQFLASGLSSLFEVVSTNETQSIIITSPASGEIWERGKTYTVKWKINDELKAKIKNLQTGQSHYVELSGTLQIRKKGVHPCEMQEWCFDGSNKVAGGEKEIIFWINNQLTEQEIYKEEYNWTIPYNVPDNLLQPTNILLSITSRDTGGTDYFGETGYSNDFKIGYQDKSIKIVSQYSPYLPPGGEIEIRWTGGANQVYISITDQALESKGASASKVWQSGPIENNYIYNLPSSVISSLKDGHTYRFYIDDRDGHRDTSNYFKIDSSFHG